MNEHVDQIIIFGSFALLNLTKKQQHFPGETNEKTISLERSVIVYDVVFSVFLFMLYLNEHVDHVNLSVDLALLKLGPVYST